MPPRRLPLRPIAWSIAAALLAVPFVAGAPWTASDYALAAAMVAMGGGAVEIAVWGSGSVAWRAGTIVAIAATFLLIWVNGAVGFLGDEGDPANAAFAIVPLVALAGAILAGFRARGMARAMLAAAVAQGAVGVMGWAMGHAAPGGPGVYATTMGTALFGTLWLVAAALFARAARQSAHSRVASPSI